MGARMRYTGTAIALHWSSALLVLATVPLALYMTSLRLSPLKLELYAYHKWIGVTVAVLTVARLAWRRLRPPPPLLPMPRWQHTLATRLHAALYGLLIAVPVSGWLMSSALGFQTVYLGVLPLPDLLAKDPALGEALKGVHAGFNLLLGAAIVLHVGGALKHHFIDRDDTLRRILPWHRSQA